MQIFIILVLSFCSIVFGDIESENASVASPEMSNGERIYLAEKGFSVKPPVGWEVHRDRAGASLLFQIPYTSEETYQRTIQILAFDGPQYIDKFTEEDFATIITEKYSRAAGAAGSYRMRNRLPIELRDGSPAILFYTEFTVNQRALMQLHVLCSSADRHFILTYTDIAENFDTSKGSPHLETAYDSVISAELESQVPSRFQIPVLIIGSLVIFGLLSIGLRYLFGRRNKYLDQNLEEISDDEVEDDFEIEIDENSIDEDSKKKEEEQVL